MHPHQQEKSDSCRFYTSIVTQSITSIITLLFPSMRKEEQQNLDFLLNNTYYIDDGNSSNNGGVLQQLKNVAKQRVNKIDYQQQIERWNKYQELLDKIDQKCKKAVGVRLARNVKHNVKMLGDTEAAALSIIGLIALLTMWGANTIEDGLYGMIGSAVALGFVGWQTAIRLHHPSVIHFKCRPVLHIDEFAYMRQAINGIPPAEHDPIVRLPVLEMSIPRAWIAQQGMLKFMESLADIELDKEKSRGEKGTSQ